MHKDFKEEHTINPTKRSILYVDDEVGNLRIFATTFKRYYNVFVANSGREGLDIIRKNEIHVLISDQMMPEMTGVQFIQKANEISPNLVSIILTAYSDVDLIIKAINECNIYRYVTKPWDIRDFKITIDNAVERYELMDSNKKLIRNLKDANETLEQKVQERTQALHQAYNDLYKSNQIKDKLFSVISHDLRAPLATLSSFLYLFIKNKTNFTEEEVLALAKSMSISLNEVIDLLENLLQWSKSQMGIVHLEKKKVFLKSLIEKNAKLFMATAEQKNIKIIIELIEADLYVWADENMLNLILRNFINNALKYTKEGGKIYVNCIINGNQIQIDVEDTGVGMPDDKVNRLLAEEWFSSTRGTNNEKGTGLGLRICSEFIREIGGKFHVESFEGMGSTFSFTIPISA